MVYLNHARQAAMTVVLRCICAFSVRSAIIKMKASRQAVPHACMTSIRIKWDKEAVVDALQLIIKTKQPRLAAASARRLRFRLDTTQQQSSSMLIAVLSHVLQATTRHNLYV
jgi:hypothetical protein